MNTRAKRASSVGIGLAFVLAPPAPDGSLSASDRKAAAFSYAASFAVIAPVPEPIISPTTGSIVRVFSDLEMNCPAEWYDGPKEARVERSGYGERVASDMVSGDPVSATFTLRLWDGDGLFRRAMASRDLRYWIDPVPIRMTSRDNRAALGRMFLVFAGPIIDAQPVRPMAFEFTLGDLVSRQVLSDHAMHPSRKVGDGFIHDTTTTALGDRVALSSALDFETPEPIILGRHRRVRNVDPPSAHGFERDLTDNYLGIWNVGGGNKHVWLGAGHACAGISDVNKVAADGTHTTLIPDEGASWWFPHHAGWFSLFGAPYIDLRSTSFGNLRRYTLFLGEVGNADADACAYASGGYAMDTPPDPVRLMAFIDGVEPNGDGSGDVIVDRVQQAKHWWKQYGVRTAAGSYQSGPYTDPPPIVIHGEPAPIPAVDEASFDAISAINAIRYPSDGGDPPVAGQQGAFIIGAKAGDIFAKAKWIADLNRSCFMSQVWTRKGACRVGTPHPTEAAKAAARLYTDATEHRQGTFETVIRYQDHANRIPFRYDPDHASGQWAGAGSVDAGDSIANYDDAIIGDVREFPGAPGEAMATHVAFLHAYLFKDPPRRVTFEDTVGPDENGESLGYLEVFEYFKYKHYAAVGEPGQIRLAWVIRHQVQVGARRVLVEGWDMEDLIGFDVPTPFAEVGELNETCALAIVITNGADEAYAITIDTTAHATDTDVAGIAGLPGPAVGYHAAHFAYTPPANGTLFLTTVHSQYDTQIAVTTGDCGSLELVEDGYNDNDGILTTSVLELAVTGGVPLHIIVYGYGPDDGGALTFGLLFTAA